jgi:hypothetical protein
LQSFFERLAAFSQLLRSCFNGIARQTSFRKRYASSHRSLQRLRATAVELPPEKIARHKMKNKLKRTDLLEKFLIDMLPSASKCSRAKMPHTKDQRARH